VLRRIILTAYTVALAAVAAGAAYVIFFADHVFVTTPSMYPTIPPGSLVFIQKESSYHVGDVIEFRGNGLTFMHRIIRISPNGDITTKGDNPQNAPDYFDPPITASDVSERRSSASSGPASQSSSPATPATGSHGYEPNWGYAEGS